MAEPELQVCARVSVTSMGLRDRSVFVSGKPIQASLRGWLCRLFTFRLIMCDGGAPICGNLTRLSANLFSGSLSRQSLLRSPLLTRFQVVGMTLHFFNDVFRLNLALEPTQGSLQ